MTDEQAPGSPSAGWYADPGKEFHRRYWDGARWTPGVSDRSGSVHEAPLPVEGAAAAWAALEDQRGRWSGWVALVAVLAAVLATFVGGLFAVIGDRISTVGALVGGAIGLYGTLFATCWLVSRQRGTGNLTRDFGLGFRRGDWWRGLAFMGLARLGAIVVAVLLYAINSDLAGTNTGGFDDHKDSLAFLVTAGVLAVVAAPFFEELFFRGLLQRSLETAVPVPVAIGLQAMLFGLAHLGGGEGIGNVGVVLSTAAAGVFFGIAARRWHRLGPGMAAHAWFNLLPVIVLFATR